MNIIQSKKLTWIDIRNPKEEDIKELKKTFNLHPLVLKELLPPLNHPKVENFGDYLYIVLFYPFFEKKTYQTIPFELDIIISKNYIITSYYKNIVPLKAIFDKCNLYENEKEKYMDNGAGELLYTIIREIFKACFPKLDHVKHNIDGVENKIYRKEYQKVVNQISLVKRDIIGFQRIIEPQNLVLKNLTKESPKIFSKKIIPYFHSLESLYNRVNDILSNHSKTLDALDSTNESLLTNRTNDIIKLLTIFSVIVFPLTLMASIFGMNTDYLPFVGGKYDFWIISGIMTMGVGIMLAFFKAKKWI